VNDHPRKRKPAEANIASRPASTRKWTVCGAAETDARKFQQSEDRAYARCLPVVNPDPAQKEDAMRAAATKQRISDRAKAAWRPRPMVEETRAMLASRDAIKAKLAEVHARHAKRQRRRRPQLFAEHRLRDLSAIIEHRFGAELPDDAVGYRYLDLVAHHAANLIGDQARNIRKRTSRWAPWMTRDRLADLTAKAIERPQRWKADRLARILGLKAAERRELGVTTIGSIDMGKAARTKARKTASRKRSEARRRDAGAIPRAEYEANSLSRSRPWEALGISRRTWERRQKAAAASARVASPYAPLVGLQVRTDLRQPTQPCGSGGLASEPGPIGVAPPRQPTAVRHAGAKPPIVRVAARDQVRSMDLRHPHAGVDAGVWLAASLDAQMASEGRMRRAQSMGRRRSMGCPQALAFLRCAFLGRWRASSLRRFAVARIF
jgi:hypothetical protein